VNAATGSRTEYRAGASPQIAACATSR
jgi:hypothetical protein